MRNQNDFIQWLLLVALWVGILNMINFVGITQTQLIMELLEVEWQDHTIVKSLLSAQQYLEATLFGLFFGSFLFLINRLTDRPSMHKKSFSQVILLRSGLYLVSVGVVGFLIYNILDAFGLYPQELKDLVIWGDIIRTPFIIQALILLLFFTLVSNFILATARKVGPGYFSAMLTGKYHHPVTENRLFLFIDLQGSSRLAEKLGHIRYSKLLQDCFRELDIVVFRYKAQLYQYVGDEAVLTWQARSGFKYSRCLHLYFAFCDRLKKKAPYFQEKYGVQPFFKAGLNVGEVTVAEIGNIKREIAYHGDVMNTASRLQGLCNHYQRWLIISQDVRNALHPDPAFRINAIGSIELRGREKPVSIYGVERTGADLSSSVESPEAAKTADQLA